MQRGILQFSKNESFEIGQLLESNETASTLLRQKFSIELEEFAGYELSAEDANWLLDQLPIPQESTAVELSIRKKLGAFLAQT